jgi:hypothetical protein
MEHTSSRRVPLIVVAGRAAIAQLIEDLRAQGAVVYETRAPEGCLRVATAVGRDVVLLPPGFPRRLVALLEHHPKSAGASIVWLRPEVAWNGPVAASRVPAHGQPLYRAARVTAATAPEAASVAHRARYSCPGASGHCSSSATCVTRPLSEPPVVLSCRKPLVADGGAYKPRAS